MIQKRKIPPTRFEADFDRKQKEIPQKAKDELTKEKDSYPTKLEAI